VCFANAGNKWNNVENVKHVISEGIYNNPDYILMGAKNENKNLVGSLMGIVCRDVVGGADHL
jgi:hypothetical protein